MALVREGRMLYGIKICVYALEEQL